MLTRTEIESMIEDCEKRSEKLTDWEVSFIADISEVFIRYGKLSSKQTEILDRIWESVT